MLFLNFLDVFIFDKKNNLSQKNLLFVVKINNLLLWRYQFDLSFQLYQSEQELSVREKKYALKLSEI